MIKKILITSLLSTLTIFAIGQIIAIILLATGLLSISPSNAPIVILARFTIPYCLVVLGSLILLWKDKVKLFAAIVGPVITALIVAFVLLLLLKLSGGSIVDWEFIG